MIRGQKVIFRLVAPVPQRGTLSSGRVGGFCRAHRRPTSAERRLKIFYAVSEIFRVQLLPFSPHIVTTDEISEPHKRHIIVVDGMYKVSELHDPSLLRARVGGH